jgi:hypothetical protein
MRVVDQLRRLKMNSSKIKRFKAVKLIAAFFISEKKLYTEEAYVALGHRQPVTGASIRYIFGGYAGMITCIKQSAFWDELKRVHASKPAPEVKPVVTPQVEVPKPAEPKPKAAVKPAVKTAVKEGSTNE